MRRNSRSDGKRARQRLAPTVAFLWDESFLWGLMAYRALKGLALPFDLIRAEDLKSGVLDKYRMLFVPGGWASNKSKSLGDTGMKAIRDFVHNGGSYLGFCGGAGLATRDGIGLLNINRRPTKERVPSFSGRIYLNIKEHQIWKGITTAMSGQLSAVSKNTPPDPQPLTPIFHAWWPSQFEIKDKNIKTLATYGNALPDSFSSDLNTGDVEANGNWEELEKVYRINLDPKRLLNEPAVIEGNYGSGKVVLSLVHFETPDDMNGQQVLKNLWGYLGGRQQRGEAWKFESEEACKRGSAEDKNPASELLALCSDLISLGERNFLWFWRNPMLLQWRRGVRGLEYCTLYVLIKEIEEIARKRVSTEDKNPTCELASLRASGLSFDDNLYNIRNLIIPFTEKAKRLLILERQAMQKGHITYERCDDPEIQKIRAELFSDSKSHGGEFKKLIDEIEDLLFLLIKLGRV
jgi:hypothetical protein